MGPVNSDALLIQLNGTYGFVFNRSTMSQSDEPGIATLAKNVADCPPQPARAAFVLESKRR
jgi:hypothetical protein